MKPPKFEYVRAASVDEAAVVKAAHDGDASILAGGQSLIPMLNFRLARPSALIDLNHVDGLAYVRVGDDAVRVGAMTRQRDVERHEDAALACPVLPQALAHVAHPVVRNRGTIGGTVAHADAAAETPAALLALDGRVRVRGTAGERTIEAADLFVFHLTSSLRVDEVLVEVEFPRLPAGAGSAFREVTRRHGDYALAGVCAIAVLGEDGSMRDVRLAYSGIAPTTIRATAAEDLLAGAAPSAEAFAAAGAAAADCVDAIDEEQATVAYRRQLVRSLTARALEDACAAARRSQQED
ncbi:MAG: aerobic carbon-monoxide dehydrogenase medium subunit [Solirubrobacteraceae bacterium]|jgi:carbon-monoxide dehydrogenase medium subunit|nr:aerobic carbon-monoxide dehydrogenase medium subunit [Solirubrobacteraceae bacterium]